MTNKKTDSLWEGTPVKSLAVSPNGKYIISGSSDYTIRLWDMHSGKELMQYINS